MKIEHRIVIFLLALISVLVLASVTFGRIDRANSKERKWTCEYGKYCYNEKEAEIKCKYIKKLESEALCEKIYEK